MKKKTICIVGGVYNMAIMDATYIMPLVQADLDYIYGKGTINFSLSKEPDGSFRLVFKRKYGDFYSPTRTIFSGEKTVFAPDAHILLGSMRKDHPTVADLQSWDNAYIQYLSLSDVLKDYQKASKVRGSEVVKSLDVEESGKNVVFIVRLK